MKISAKGAVTFSVRNDDKDLHDLIEGLPSQVGSDMIRAILRDGLEYQRVNSHRNAPMSHLSMLCQLRKMNIAEVVQPFFANDVSQSAIATPSPDTRQFVQDNNTNDTLPEVKSIHVENLDDAFDLGANDTEY